MYRHPLKKSARRISGLFLFTICLTAVLLGGPGLLEAGEALGNLFDTGGDGLPAVGDEELSAMTLLDTGWTPGEENRQYSPVLINDSAALFCLPTEMKEDLLMMPLPQFCLIAGCSLETAEENKFRLVKDHREYLLEAGSPWLINDSEISVFPVKPYEAHGRLYVPLRFLCEALDIGIRWQSNTILLNSPGIDAALLPDSLAAENQALLAALEAEEGPKLSGAMEVTVTFYFTDDGTAYTASGNPAVAGSLAADPGIPFGTQYYIPGLDFVREDCLFTVHDRGGAVRGSLLDVYLPASVRSDPDCIAALRAGRYDTTAYLVLPGEAE